MVNNTALLYTFPVHGYTSLYKRMILHVTNHNYADNIVSVTDTTCIYYMCE